MWRVARGEIIQKFFRATRHAPRKLRCLPADRLDRFQDDIIIVVLAQDLGDLGDLDQGLDQAEAQIARQRTDIGDQVLLLLQTS